MTIQVNTFAPKCPTPIAQRINSHQARIASLLCNLASQWDDELPFFFGHFKFISKIHFDLLSGSSAHLAANRERKVLFQYNYSDFVVTQTKQELVHVQYFRPL